MRARAPSELIRRARRDAGLTQQELARRLATTQPVIARLESRNANPRIETLARALAACGRELVLDVGGPASGIDETLVASRLRLNAGERLASFERSYANVRRLVLAGRNSASELA